MSHQSAILEYIPALRRYARVVVINKLIADQLVKDCVEETLATDQHKAYPDLRTTLFHCLARKLRAVDYDRKGVRDLTADALQELLDVQSKNNDQAQNLIVGLSRLNQSEREVLILTVLEGFRYKDIGKMTGTPLDIVMSRLHRARELLRQSVFGTGIL